MPENLAVPARGILPVSYLAALARAAAGNTLSIAYSGGVDSRFLAFSSRCLGYRVRLLHAVGPQMARAESEEAESYAAGMGAVMVRVAVGGLSMEELAEAGRMRCYACKKKVFASLLALVPEGKLCDGTNASDGKGWRPGVAALRELGIFSPLAEGGLEKSQIREYAMMLGMPDPQQAARPCLLTRFPYGVIPQAGELELIAAAEEYLASLPEGAGLRFRLRIPQKGRPVLHIERASLPPGGSGLPGKLEEELRRRFSPRLDGLAAEAVDRLSGYYDRVIGVQPFR